MARGEITTDLLANLFKGYLSSKDRNFRDYIQDKQQSYDEGTIYTIDQLMLIAANKHKTLVESGKWMALSPEEEKTVALEAQIRNMGKKQTAQSSSNQSNKANTSNTGSGKSGKKSKKKKMKKSELPEWKLKFPGQAFIDAGKYKEVNGRRYYWCKHHGFFTAHKPEDCKLQQSQGSNPSPSNQPNPNPVATPAPSLRVSTATMMNE